jgi:phage shock protein E
MSRRTATAATLLIAIGLGFYLTRGTADRTSSERAHQLVERGARVVDVRTPAEHRRHRIPGSINIPLQQLEQRISELEPKHAPVVLYCRSGRRSGIAA